MTIGNWLLLVGGGAVAGAANTLAGGGSAITLPLLVFCGVPPSVANGTNHLSHLAGSLARSLAFQRSGHVDWRNAFRLAIPGVLGALVGSRLASSVPDPAMHWIIIGAAVIAAALILSQPHRLLRSVSSPEIHVGLFQLGLIFVVGAWAGFIVVGAGTFLLMVLTLAIGYDLVRAMALNGVIGGLTMVAATSVFLVEGQIDWMSAAVLATGTAIGGWSTARLAVRPELRGVLNYFVVGLILVEIGLMLLKGLWH